ncbi:V-set and immunoglobulin domain-containing protein 4 isoform X1 [Varanus komodoensis]|uniref:V-set and immunoglobulin domain-containing protein 4 isoform X1 n=1 Tax=Varanus komodoensis TaxID=61221 RepID=UPI001CF7964A|nr:V-set and immunoglobulin domain-containing protein 4 isoform X1 [Varanus komodoensis]
MGRLAGTWFLVLLTTGGVTAVLDLQGLQVVNGTWRAAITLPCVYEPSADFKELRVIWKASWDALKTIFHRDANSGDQVLLTTFKGRLSVAKGLPGSVSLLIHQLEMTDTAQYTCEVSWEARNKSLIKRERMTTLKVIKVPASKPIITLSRNASVLPVGSRTSLTCSASGSPTITYKWFKEGPGSIDKLLGRTAVLTLDRLQASDSGSYYCTAENRVSSQRRRSDAVRLTVQESEAPTLRPDTKEPTPTGAETTTAHWKHRVGTVAGPVDPRRAAGTQTDPVATSRASRGDGTAAGSFGLRKASLPLYLIVLIAVLCAALLIAVGLVILCRRKPKSENRCEVTYTNYAMTSGDTIPVSLGIVPVCGVEYEDPTQMFGNNYTMEPTKGGVYVTMGTNAINDYDILPNKMESEYEIGD